MSKRFSEVLHPEYVLDLRGSKKLRDIYKEMLSLVEYHDDKHLWSVEEDANTRLDKNALNHVLMVKKYWYERPMSYRFGKEFLEVLCDVDLDITSKVLPERFFCHLSFPKKTLSDGEEYITDCYFYIGKGHETPLMEEHHDERVIWASYVSSKTSGDDAQDFSIVRLLVAADHKVDVSLTEVIASMESEDYINNIYVHDEPVTTFGHSPAKLKVWQSILNCILYVVSQNPDVKHLKPVRQLTKSQRKQPGMKNMCEIPVTFVSWGYKKPISYNVDSTWVDSHPRWQRCGPNYSQVKLIWVRGHKRQYKKENEDEGTG